MAAALVVTDFAQLPVTLTMAHLTAIYQLHEATIRRLLAAEDQSLPRPAFLRPYRWRRDDVRRHHDRASAEAQRRAYAVKKARGLRVAS